MAVYAAPSKRRRATIAIGVAALVVGLVLGIVIGRATAPTIDDQVKTGRDGGRALVTALQVLPLEYSQALTGSEGTAQIGDTVDRVAGQLQDALDGAPWLTAAQRAQATAAVQAVKTAAANKVPAGRFASTVTSASEAIQTVFGLPATAGGG